MKELINFTGADDTADWIINMVDDGSVEMPDLLGGLAFALRRLAWEQARGAGDREEVIDRAVDFLQDENYSGPDGYSD